MLVHLDAAYSLARWLAARRQRAEDVVQEASLRAFRFFDGLHGASPKAWFVAIVRNACLDWIGAQKRRGIEECFDDEAHGMAMRDAAGPFESPETLAERAGDARHLHACIDALPLEFREVLILREIEEMSYQEISAVVGVPMGTVMSRLSRGREQLAQPRARFDARESVMNCDRALRVLDAGLDGELDAATDAELEEHLAACPACAQPRNERQALRERSAPRRASARRSGCARRSATRCARPIPSGDAAPAQRPWACAAGPGELRGFARLRGGLVDRDARFMPHLREELIARSRRLAGERRPGSTT